MNLGELYCFNEVCLLVCLKAAASFLHNCIQTRKLLIRQWPLFFYFSSSLPSGHVLPTTGLLLTHPFPFPLSQLLTIMVSCQMYQHTTHPEHSISRLSSHSLVLIFFLRPLLWYFMSLLDGGGNINIPIRAEH